MTTPKFNKYMYALFSPFNKHQRNDIDLIYISACSWFELLSLFDATYGKLLTRSGEMEGN